MCACDEVVEVGLALVLWQRLHGLEVRFLLWTLWIAWRGQCEAIRWSLVSYCKLQKTEPIRRCFIRSASSSFASHLVPLAPRPIVARVEEYWSVLGSCPVTLYYLLFNAIPGELCNGSECLDLGLHIGRWQVRSALEFSREAKDGGAPNRPCLGGTNTLPRMTC